MSTASVNLAVIIVSYCNADDVDRCLKSLARSDWDRFEVFICENGGEAAYRRLLAALVGPDRALQRTSDASDTLDQPQKRLAAVAKCRFKDRTNAVRVGLAIENLGYGGGVNAWLEPLLGVPGWGSVLVLNPDTEVDSRGLSELIAKSAEGFGMVGGSLVFHNTPEKIINYGLHWSQMTGRVVAIGRNAPIGSAPSAEDLGRIDAVSGACVLATRAFVEDVGLMAEDYFLYMEDLDWGRRRGRHRIGFASKAIIRHIGGTTIGSAVAPEKRSHLSIYLSARNGIVYARRFAGWRWICHFGVGLLFVVRYMIKGSLSAGRVAFVGLLDGAKGKTGRPDAAPAPQQLD
ncbi:MULTISPECIES: glycosyltransferase [unclassified Bradyrhizobium]|jgi:GT2 family glycosyltransferase|uniref:glycosyltransferase n=1 Tax=unclassified Bradyrhizobium TaxID=2631580 RepID=UPI0004775576|nr:MULTISPECIES: glycosyltransferase [unclassified Bradyrhizobium]MCK1323916.1 glycosyltransferase family 2 protein [Bradyrhizobium sp. 156]MCK1351815.1 glycosyltransferase family 2 protein [Bradyrhizobium sp. CW7]MCK1418054.1 glycosyltransferase family 2 protein [Bradyrhizobium sp. CW4]MCK1495638.1 glycosyltransferase family 2 protein [Bradyrhizobium sp. 188]MCK1564483.1 glycosyltransferase family 2 protein [Bradyrhizobium sp. 173]